MSTYQMQRADTNYASLKQIIEVEIRKSILQGTLKPGGRIIESNIAREMGVSRSPIREVLSALEREGLVNSIPRHGYYVVEFSEKDIEEIYSFRALLESAALKLALPKMSSASFDHLQNVINHMQESIENDASSEKLAEFDMAFHDTFFQIADHSRMYSVWESLKSQTLLLMSITSKTHLKQSRLPHHIHQELLDQIKENGLDGVDRVVAEHISEAEQRALQSIQLLND